MDIKKNKKVISLLAFISWINHSLTTFLKGSKIIRKIKKFPAKQ